ncbi:hypothetical protein AAES_65076 [Amazona aestiva]|uniref:Uncharacterized protein n=1 Tax=Amazona aestiva TaxID=12930 RepID=A0A0Q3MK73_AMAAE|nr:hypothetical protein AAES_65076 [Amazona aestiva]
MGTMSTSHVTLNHITRIAKIQAYVPSIVPSVTLSELYLQLGNDYMGILTAIETLLNNYQANPLCNLCQLQHLNNLTELQQKPGMQQPVDTRKSDTTCCELPNPGLFLIIKCMTQVEVAAEWICSVTDVVRCFIFISCDEEVGGGDYLKCLARDRT